MRLICYKKPSMDLGPFILKKEKPCKTVSAGLIDAKDCFIEERGSRIRDRCGNDKSEETSHNQRDCVEKQ
jgi:hypothetical protein